MATEGDRRPYGPYAHLEAFLERIRARNLPGVVDTDFLNLVQIPRRRQGLLREALEFLELVDEEGAPTAVLSEYAGTTEEAAQVVLRDALRAAYASDFEQIDPTKDSQAEMRNWFQRYEPRSATGQMVTFYLGACRQAGIEVKDPPRERKIQTGKTTTGKSRGRASTASKSESGSATAVDRQRSSQTPERLQATPTIDAGVLVSVTNEDIAGLDEKDFADVWNALGKIVRKRAQREQQTGSDQDTEPVKDIEESAEN
jgi:hypothetical protein